MRHLNSFNADQRLIGKLGEGKAHIVWSMGLFLDETDLGTLAAECLTDKSDDKKIDFIKIDRDNARIIFTQGYYSKKKGATAPSNKASDLNTAAAWIFSGDLSQIPEGLRPHIEESRSALSDGEIDTIELIYVHNLSESKNVETELKTAATHLSKIINTSPTVNIEVVYKELGIETLERLYTTRESAIEVQDKQICPAQIIFHEEGPKWKAGVMSVPGSWLHSLYQSYSDLLFSANYRGFLGNSKRRKINATIRQTAEAQPSDFWVFNNGITMLTLGITNQGESTELTGVSIINGAQTTGSIGSLDLSKHSIDNLKVLCRVIQCSDKDTINDIVRYNNTQNEIKTWDMYANSADQIRIAKEFLDLGFEYVIKRMSRPKENPIEIEEVAQPLVAFHGNPGDANRGKNVIFERKPLYKQAFDDRGAKHILFVFTLARAIDEIRIKLKKKSQQEELIEIESNQLSMLRHLRFKFFLIAVMAKCCETILDKKINIDTISFSTKAAKDYGMAKLVMAWMPIVTIVLTFLSTDLGDELSEKITRDDAVEKYADNVKKLVYASRVGGTNQNFVDFKALVAA